ncbi:acetate--CoA ligase family protein [Mangrovitalea sediminis]|uniref:acetate--CoA ligase family protein n=1 Tax=Mangrovitalea sediminis TaxID=1982043 RepID=UPI000BE5F481|nr:acetate--CoA ligase [Mangrovitalea sediminis]
MDQAASRSELHAFLAPNSIAVIGASNDPTKRGYKALVGLIDGGYEGQIYPINPKSPEILGLRAYPSVQSLPAAADLALICTPASSVPGLLRECGRNGTRGAIILASGFGEIGGEGVALEAETLAAAREAGVRIIGPNTSGMFNLHKKVNLLALQNVRPGDIGIVSQSGNMLLALALEAQRNGYIGFSTYVGPGNQTDIGFGDYLRYLSEDEHTRVATFYIEGFKDGRAFLDAAREATRVKPVVVYKSGSTQAGQKSASSHTGALAGSYAMTVDLLRQNGVNVVGHSDEILPVAEGLGLLQQTPGKRIAILSDGGGQATIASDRISEAGLELAELSDQTRARLGSILFPQASLANPIDVAGSTDANPGLFTECVDILLQDDQVDMVFLVGMFGGYGVRFDQSLESAENRCAVEMAQSVAARRKGLVVYSLYAPIRPVALMTLREAGIPVYDSIELAVSTLRALSERGAYLQRANSAPQRLSLQRSSDADTLFARALSEGRDLLEPEARQVLADYGIPLPESRWVHTAEDLFAAAADYADRPVAMKIVSRDILHKSDAGGVRLNLVGETALSDARDAIEKSCLQYAPEARLEGVLLTPMATKGVEVIIGASRDPVFGPVVMFGLGGIFVELFKDVAFRAAPLSRYDAEAMIAQVKASRILDGIRGEPAVDKQALIDLLLRISSMMELHPEIESLDLNPVIARADGCELVDARIIVKAPELN